MSLRKVNTLEVVGSIFSIDNPSGIEHLREANGKPGNMLFCYHHEHGYEPGQGLIYIADLGITLEPTTIHTKDLSKIYGIARQLSTLDMSRLKINILRTEKDLRKWPVEALIFRLSTLSGGKGQLVSHRTSKLMKETRDLPLPERINRLANEIRNLKFYKTMER